MDKIRKLIRETIAETLDNINIVPEYNLERRGNDIYYKFLVNGIEFAIKFVRLVKQLEGVMLPHDENIANMVNNSNNKWVVSFGLWKGDEIDEREIADGVKTLDVLNPVCALFMMFSNQNNVDVFAYMTNTKSRLKIYRQIHSKVFHNEFSYFEGRPGRYSFFIRQQ